MPDQHRYIALASRPEAGPFVIAQWTSNGDSAGVLTSIRVDNLDARTGHGLTREEYIAAWDTAMNLYPFRKECL